MTEKEQLLRAKAELEMLKGDIALFGPAGDDLQRIAKLQCLVIDLEAKIKEK